MFNPKQQIGMLRQQLALSPDALAVTIPHEDVKEALLAARDPLLPTYTYNTGQRVSAEVGALTYVGQREYEAGRRAGEYFAAHGVLFVYCLNQIYGHRDLLDRCEGLSAGLRAGGGRSEMIFISDTSSVDIALAELRGIIPKAQRMAGLMFLSSGMIEQIVRLVRDDLQRADLQLACFDFHPKVCPPSWPGSVALWDAALCPTPLGNTRPRHASTQ